MLEMTKQCTAQQKHDVAGALTESAGPGVESRLRRVLPGGIGSGSCTW